MVSLPAKYKEFLWKRFSEKAKLFREGASPQKHWYRRIILDLSSTDFLSVRNSPFSLIKKLKIRMESTTEVGKFPI